MSVNPRQYLSITPLPKYVVPDITDQVSFAKYLLKVIQALNVTLADLVEAAPQVLSAAPIGKVRFGTMRYAIGAWATTLGADGLYVFKDDSTWHKIV